MSQTNNNTNNTEEKIVVMYNEEVKNEFLSMYDGIDTRKTYRRIFEKSYHLENKLKKDLCNFDKDEIEDVLYDLNPLTKTSSETNGRIITSYITWCIERKYADTTVNILKSVDSSWFEKFVDKNKKLYFSEEEIRAIENKCENLQDAVIIRMLFCGINGKESIEIRMLNRNDVNGNTLTLRNKDWEEIRKVEVDDRTIKMIQGAFIETKYVKRNGMMKENIHVRDFNDLVDNNFIVRNSMLGKIVKSEVDPVVPSVIYRRVSVIGEVLDIPFFTTKNIFRSGVIHMGYKILKEKHEKGIVTILTTEDYIKIAEQFNIKNHYTIKEYCNIENIEELYGKFE